MDYCRWGRSNYVLILRDRQDNFLQDIRSKPLMDAFELDEIDCDYERGGLEVYEFETE